MTVRTGQNREMSKGDPRHQPTKADLEELLEAIFDRHPRRSAPVSEPCQ